LHRLPPELTIEIPPERIAQYPSCKRDESRLLIYDRDKGAVIHVGYFPDVIDFIGGDLIILNDTRVIPAHVDGRKPGGGKVSLLFLVPPPHAGTGVINAAATVVDSNLNTDKYHEVVKALINPRRRLRPGLQINLPNDAIFVLIEKTLNGRWTGLWRKTGAEEQFINWLERVGKSPLPPYIRRNPEPSDRDRYQTVYATQTGSLAAPTAGFHFTDDILNQLKSKGSSIEYLTLDVGLGTFQPIRDDDLSCHIMHTETYHIPVSTAAIINNAKQTGLTLTAVGTTVVRTLEAAAINGLPIKPGSNTADIFIYPPYKFKVIERLLTNFHRPDSTLMQLLAAFIGWEGVNLSYQAALDAGFRFYSYGDSMLVI